MALLGDGQKLSNVLDYAQYHTISTQENDNTDTEDKEKKKKNEACDDDTCSNLCVKTCKVAQCAGCFSPFVGQVQNK